MIRAFFREVKYPTARTEVSKIEIEILIIWSKDYTPQISAIFADRFPGTRKITRQRE